MILEKVFAGLSVMTAADFLERNLCVRGKFIFSRFLDKDSVKQLFYGIHLSMRN